MEANVLSYLLALDIFALTAFVMVYGPVGSIVRGVRDRLLPALLVLVMLRSLQLVLYLNEQTLSVPLFGGLEILTFVCIIWGLLKLSAHHVRLWWWYSWLGLGLSFLLALFSWLAPVFDWQLGATLVALGGLPLVFARQDRVRWPHGITPLLLALYAILNWANLATTSQFVALMAYGSLVYIVFNETTISADLRQREIETLNAEAQRYHTERVRFLEISSVLSAASEPTSFLDYAARVLGQTMQVDQVAVLTLSRNQSGMAYLAATYKGDAATRSLPLQPDLFPISDNPLLLDILESQRQVVTTTITGNPPLKGLYNLWQESRLGPTLLQPLALKKKVVGILILGNPVSMRPVPQTAVRLCQKLAAQLAAMVFYQQEHDQLRNQAEELAAKYQLLQGDHDQLADVLEAVEDGIVVSRADGRISLLNHAAEKILARKKEALLDQPIGNIYGQISSTESIDKLAVDFSRGNQAIPTYFEERGKIIRGRLIPLRNERQEWMGIMAVLRDVTSDVELERARTKVFDTLSKEIRTPLTTIKGYVDLMSTGGAGDLDLQQRHFLNVIKMGADEVTALIDRAMNQADEEISPLKRNLKKIDVQQVLRDAGRASGNLLRINQTSLEMDIAMDMPRVRLDEVKLRQIVSQLIANAGRQAGAGGQVSLQARIQSQGLGSQTTDYLLMSISNNGASLAPDQLSALFEPPNPNSDLPPESTQTTATELAIIRDLIEEHGGRIWAESLAGEGNVFQVALPCSFN